MWVTFFGAWLLFGLLGPRLGWARQRTGALILVCGLGNTSFMGYPLVEALRGKPGLALAVVANRASGSSPRPRWGWAGSWRWHRRPAGCSSAPWA